MKRRLLGLSGWVLVAIFGLASRIGWSASANDCSRLTQLRLPDSRILSAETIHGPSFTPPVQAAGPGPAGSPAALEELPPFCRVSAVVSPAVHFELWLPLTDWNGKFEGTGNGGYAGAIVYSALALGVRRHYAVASTDMGHTSTAPDPGSWALGHPELIVDQGYRAQHETAVRSKEIVRAFYRAKPRLSYFVGCSSGGWQGLTEAQRYPQEYNGIVAGAPAFEVIHLHAGTLWTHFAALTIGADKFRLITDAVLAKCDAADGVKDGLLQDPRACKFVPVELACRQGQDPAKCLTDVEVTALQKIYNGLHSSTGQLIYPGWPRGVEYALPAMRQPFVAALAASTFKDMAFADPSWDYHHIDFARDVRRADEKVGAVLNNFSPNLKEFRAAGGKPILWHGWDDPLISPLHTLEYYEKMAAYLSGHTAPGLRGRRGPRSRTGFCPPSSPQRQPLRGGPGPDTFDALAALEGWVEHGTAPEQLVASHKTNGTVDRTRPLCA